MAKIDALLHLGALGVAVPIGYIGLDRVREYSDKLKDEIRRVREEVRQEFLKMDIKQAGKTHLKHVFDNFKTLVLCHVAQEKVSMGLRRLWHPFHRQWYVPILGYFRRRADLVVVSVIGIVLAGFFLAFTAASIWEWPMPPSFPETYFALLVISLTWIFVTVALSYRIRRIKVICDRLLANVRARRQEILDEGVVAFPGGDPRGPQGNGGAAPPAPALGQPAA